MDDLQNPMVRGFFDLLAKSEGTAGKGDNGYNVAFGGDATVGYDAHPGQYYTFTQTDGKQNRTSAAGRYQIIKPTYDSLAKRLGVTDFSPETQDRMALELIRENGALEDVKRGDYAAAINKLGGVWASLPSSTAPQPHRSMAELLGNQVPVQLVNQRGTPMLAAPENDFERNHMMGFFGAGHSPAMQSLLTNALARVSEARNALASERPFFDDLPMDLDNDLLDLIDRA
ncbi:glycoside hydrolase family 104 protein [Escherichia coli]|nr:glycoside hydrolase family 104 protein [Escherichia coli]